MHNWVFGMLYHNNLIYGTAGEQPHLNCN